jgi:hypothetical protein
MQINHLSQSVYTFIDTQLPAAIGYQCYTAFYLAEQLGLKEYDQSFVNLVVIDDGVEMDTVRDVFIDKVTRLLEECITGHQITLDPDATASLDDLIEIVHFLELVQRLEDMDVIAGRLFGMGTPRQIFVDVLCQLSHMQAWRALELIEDVNESLILALQQLTEDKGESSNDSPDKRYHQEVQLFQQFVEGTSCLGLSMYHAGYTALLWETLTSLIPVDLTAHFATLSQADLPQCALDFLSLTLVCKDSYQTPAMHLQKVIGQYIDDAAAVTKIYAVVMQILVDYQTHKEAALQQPLQEVHK